MIQTRDANVVEPIVARIGGWSDCDLHACDNWHAYIFDGGVFLCVERDDGVLDLHVAVDKRARGKIALREARHAIACELGAGNTLIGRTPIAHTMARRFAAACGGVSVGVVDDEEVRVWAA